MSDLLGSHATGANAADLLSGHTGHLNIGQQTALDTLKENLTQTGVYKPPGPDVALSGMNTNGTTPELRASHDETTLLRFLRARKFDPIAAQNQISETEAWRIKHNVSALYNNFNVKEFESGKEFYPTWNGRRDKQGLPLYIYRLASLAGPKAKELNALTAQQRWERIVALQEFSIGFTLSLCSSIPHTDIGKESSGLPSSSPSPLSNVPVAAGATPISSVTTIIDLDGVSLSSMWSLRSHLQEASALCTAHYPETINTIAVVNAPSFFSTVWGWIKKWFDEGTANKIHVLGKDDPGKTLRLLIEPRNLPKVYGGELNWVYGDLPSIDEQTREVLRKGGCEGGELPRGPVLWVDGAVKRAK